MFETPVGATPLDHEDIAGLIPTYLSTRDDLNVVEAENIMKAHTKFLTHASRYHDADFLLQESTIRSIHKDMYGDVWSWAGAFRSRMTNIGVRSEQIPEMLRNLLLNTLEQIKHLDRNNQDACDELAIRFHWNLVRIHPFPNGNGRHARMMADLLIQSFSYPPFTWGSQDLVDESKSRATYLTALRKADSTMGDVDDLVRFARS